MFYCNYLTHLTVLCVVICVVIVLDKDENVSKMSSTTIFDFYVGIVCTFESSQIAASGDAFRKTEDTYLSDGLYVSL